MVISSGYTWCNRRVLDYREKLFPAWWLIVATALVVPAAILVFFPLSAVLGVVVGLTLWAGSVGLLWWGAPSLVVEEGTFRAGKARIELGFITGVSFYDGDAAREQRGVSLDARAWLVIRGWIDPVVKIELGDPDDPVPYWLVSSRKPQELVAALQAAGAVT